MRFARLCDRAVGFIALFRKKSHQKTIRFRKFFIDFLAKPCWVRAYHTLHAAKMAGFRAARELQQIWQE
tara:strand:- start:420 stop:626 length:207 start_codon:yes stop_codon:yes gene_type:complete